MHILLGRGPFGVTLCVGGARRVLKRVAKCEFGLRVGCAAWPSAYLVLVECANLRRLAGSSTPAPGHGVSAEQAGPTYYDWQAGAANVPTPDSAGAAPSPPPPDWTGPGTKPTKGRSQAASRRWQQRGRSLSSRRRGRSQSQARSYSEPDWNDPATYFQDSNEYWNEAPEPLLSPTSQEREEEERRWRRRQRQRSHSRHRYRSDSRRRRQAPGNHQMQGGDVNDVADFWTWRQHPPPMAPAQWLNDYRYHYQHENWRESTVNRAHRYHDADPAPTWRWHDWSERRADERANQQHYRYDDSDQSNWQRADRYQHDYDWRGNDSWRHHQNG
eukprot:s119_g62.t1